MQTLDIKLLNAFHLIWAGTPVTTVNQPRLQSLLAYLLLHRGAPLSRPHLAFTFWPDVSESQARNNLRQMLHHLRHALPDPGFFHADANTVYWRPDASYTLDVAEFEVAVAYITEIDHTASWRILCDAIERAISLYAGDLLPSCYDDWIVPERDHLRQQNQKLFVRLIALLEEKREYASALDYARQLLRFDPLQEDTYQLVMRLYALTDNRASALRVYYECVTTLRNELSIEPGAEIQALYERLARGDTSPQPASLAMASPRLVGRQFEWETLRTTWRQTLDEQPHFVLISGEAGLGKTRLAEELLMWAQRQGITCGRTRSYEAEGRLAYSPVTDWLRGATIFPALSQLHEIWLTELSRLLPELLAQYPHLPHPPPLTEYWQRQRFFEALAHGVLAAERPLLLLIDDLQWCDQGTLEWLRFLLRFDSHAKLLIVGTARIEEIDANPALGALLDSLRKIDQLVEVSLSPFNSFEVTELAAMLGERELNPVQAMRLFRETEGNPLFVVEMIRADLDQSLAGTTRAHVQPHHHSSPDSMMRLPKKVYYMIARRLNQLSAPAFQLAGVAATIGRAFTLDVLTLASGLDEARIADALNELWQHRVIREQGVNSYDFSHDKLREVAYAELSPIQRRNLHRRVAQALEEIYATSLDSLNPALASHYEQAGLVSQAVDHYQRAAAVAQDVFAHEEAASFLRKALTLLMTLVHSESRDEIELALQLSLAASLASFKGYGVREVMDVCARAVALCEQLGRPSSPPILRALAIAHVANAEFSRARHFAEQLARFGDERQNPVVIVESGYALGAAVFYQGEFELSRVQFERAIAHYNPVYAHDHAAWYTQDPKVVCLIRLALDLWCLGYLDQAEAKRQEAFAFAHSLAHPFSLGYCLSADILICNLRIDLQATIEQAETLITVGREHQLGQWLPLGLAFHGWATAMQGSIEAGMAELQEAINVHDVMGSLYMRPYLLALWSDIEMKTGQHERSLSLLEEAQSLIDASGGRWYETELCWRKSELLLQRGAMREAEGALARALEVARRQNARSFELRAAIRLAMLWQQQGKSAEAQQLLSPVYSWFTEGFDSPDLREAATLLDGLGASAI